MPLKTLEFRTTRRDKTTPLTHELSAFKLDILIILDVLRDIISVKVMMSHFKPIHDVKRNSDLKARKEKPLASHYCL